MKKLIVLLLPLASLCSCVKKSPGYLFNETPWEDIIRYANEGPEKLKEVFGTDDLTGMHHTYRTDVGTDKEKNYYTVHVIGQSVDTISGTDKKASLTFVFGTSETVKKWDETSNNDYAKSAINNYINNDYIANIDPDLLKGIKTVDKEYTKFENGQWSKTTMSTKIFLPSFTELNGELGTEGSENAPIEGQRYQYYNTEEQYIRDRRGIALDPYFLRTPVTNEDNKVWSVGMHGTMEKLDITGFAVLHPCFCI